jgi:hypothetical protein
MIFIMAVYANSVTLSGLSRDNNQGFNPMLRKNSDILRHECGI